MFTRPDELRSAALALAANLDPDRLTGEDAAAMVTELARVEKIVASARMFMAIRVARTGAWRGQGHASAADWLAAQCGLSVRQAAAQLGTAKKAKDLPKTKEAMSNGDLSPDQASAVTDAATADPTCEEDLLSSASKDTHKQLKDKADRARAAATDTKTRARRIHAERTLKIRTDAQGAFTLWLRGPAADGARLAAMLKPFQQDAFNRARHHPSSNGPKDTYDNRNHDAFYDLLNHLHTLAAVATGQHPGNHRPGPTTANDSGTSNHPSLNEPESVADNHSGSRESDPVAGTAASTSHDSGQSGPGPVTADDCGTDGSEPTTDSDSGGDGGDANDSVPDYRPTHPAPGSITPDTLQQVLSHQGPQRVEVLKRQLPGGNNTKVIINIDLAALRRGHTQPGETCEITGLGPLPVETARQLMDDAFIAAVIRDGTHIHTVTHLGRGLNAHQRTAIEATGLRCYNIACNQTIAIQIDHRTPWHDHPTTELANQDPLCPRCHNLKTHQKHHLEPGTGPRRLLPPGGPTPGSNRTTPSRSRRVGWSREPDPAGGLRFPALTIKGTNRP